MIDRMQQRSPAPISLAASVTLLLALAGSALVESLWLALIPATALFFLAVGAIHAAPDGPDGPVATLGAAMLRIGCVALLATAVAGLVAVAVRRVEPEWLSVAALVSSSLLVAGELAFGMALAVGRPARRRAAILFAMAIPFGVAIDVLPQLVVPIPLFFTGTGVYVGLGLLALSTARLGWAARRWGGTSQDNHGRSIAAAAPARRDSIGPKPT